MIRSVSPLWIGCLVAALAAPAAAQTPARTGSLGGGAGSGPVMTRDELRACLKTQADLTVRVAAYDAQRAALEKEKAAILAENQKLGAEKGNLQSVADSVKQANERGLEMTRRVDDWNERWQAFEKANRSGPVADRQRRQLIEEQKALQKEQADLKAASSDAAAPGAGAAAQFNQRAEAMAARTVAYNEFNKKVAKEGEDLALERDLWASECGNRRYREDDETAIKQGK
jgi:hypothetical protein